MKHKFLAVVAFASALVVGPSAQAASVTSDSFTGASSHSFSGGEHVFLPSGSMRTFTVGGVDVTYTSSGTSGYEYLGLTALGNNGGWDAGLGGYVSAFSSTAPMTFTFSTGVSQIGAFVNYYSGALAASVFTMEAFDQFGTSLELFDVAADAPLATGPASTRNLGGFRGISRGTADIAKLEIRGAIAYVVDDFTLSTYVAPTPSQVPLPAGLPLLLAGLGMMGLLRRRRR